MNKENLQRYADIKAKISELELEADTLRPEIVADMQAQKAEKVETDFGSFVLEKGRTWEFSEAVQNAEVRLKEIKKKEKAEGTATYVESPVLKFFSK